MHDCEVFIGYDARERLAWEVCARSLVRTSALPPTISPIGLHTLHGRYRRTTNIGPDGVLWDAVSRAPMATEFAIARFFVPCVARARWALFCDGDFLFRADVAELFALADSRRAVQVVKHAHHPRERVKMDGQPQTDYERKNWSSLVLWNLKHAANNRLWQEDLDLRPGLWFHQFGWLKDSEIGELPEAWNWLDGTSDPAMEPKAVHFTRGTPDMPGWENTLFAPEWNTLAGRRRAQERVAA